MIRFISALLFALTLCTAEAQTTVAWLTNATGLASLPPTSSRQAVSVGNESSGWSQWNWNAASVASTNSTTVAYTGLATGRWIQAPITGVAVGLTSSTLSSLYPNSLATRDYVGYTGSTNGDGWMNMQTWGDSLTAGDGSTYGTNNYPGSLALYSGFRIANGGVSGENSTLIRARQTAASNTWYQPTLIWAGQNNYTSPSTVQSDIAAMVANLATIGNTNRYAVLSIFGLTNYVKGTANYTIVTNLNANLLATYGQRFVDVRSYLISRYNPTNAQDVIDYNNDVVPSSLRADNQHLNNDGYKAVGAYILTNSLATLRGSWSSVANPATVQTVLHQPGPIGDEAANTVNATTLTAITINTPTFKTGYLTVTNDITANNTTSALTVATGTLNFFNYSGSRYIQMAGDGISLQSDANFIPSADGTRDIGYTTSSLRWRNAYFTGTYYGGGLNISSGATIGGASTVAGSLSVSSLASTNAISAAGVYYTFGASSKLLTLAGDGISLQSDANFIPTADGTRDIGYTTGSLRWRNAYFTGTYYGGGLNLSGGATIGGASTIASSLSVSSLVSTNGVTTSSLLLISGGNSKSLILAGDGISLQSDANLIPTADGTRDVGYTTGSLRYRNAYFTGTYYGGGANLGSLTITNTGTFGTATAGNINSTTAFSSTGTTSIGNGTGNPIIGINGATNGVKGFDIYNNSSPRWRVATTGTDSGTYDGNSILFQGYNNSGGGVTYPMQIFRDGTVAIRAPAAGTAATYFPVFASTPLSGAPAILYSRTAAEVRSDIGAGTGSGTVTSVAMTVPSGLSVSGSPVTTTGTLAVTTTLNGHVSGNGSGLTASATIPSTDITVTENTQTGTTYTVLSTDNGKVVTLNNAAAITVTVPTLSAGFSCTFIQKGAGQVTFTASGTTISNAHSQTKTFGQYAEVRLYGMSSTTFVLAGDTGT